MKLFFYGQKKTDILDAFI